jgi:hypothetical protein
MRVIAYMGAASPEMHAMLQWKIAAMCAWLPLEVVQVIAGRRR